MPLEFEFLNASDRPALMGLTTPELQETAKAALEQLGFKIHRVETHGDFIHRLAQVPYQLILIEELFACSKPEENQSLLVLQRMPMVHRRHAVVILFGYSMVTLNPLQAYEYGVHAVVNPSEMFLLVQFIQKVMADNDMFLGTYRMVQQRLASQIPEETIQALSQAF